MVYPIPTSPISISFGHSLYLLTISSLMGGGGSGWCEDVHIARVARGQDSDKNLEIAVQ